MCSLSLLVFLLYIYMHQSPKCFSQHSDFKLCVCVYVYVCVCVCVCVSHVVRKQLSHLYKNNRYNSSCTYTLWGTAVAQ